ncbi:MAG: tetratricopeptide repeat protein [Cyclobacteriaceae bacterium]|nr:tetratricopeptide repeat protein [Cyclobacteriaceae bacterium]
MKRLFSFIVLLSLSQLTFSQVNPDSLELLLKQDLVDSSRIKILSKLVWYYQDNNPPKATNYSDIAIELSKKNPNKKFLERAYQDKANTCESLGLYEESIIYNLKALALAKESNDSVSITTVYNNMGITYNQMGDYALAVYHLLKAIQLDEKRNDTLALGYDYINLAESYYYANNFQAAYTYGSMAYQFLDAVNDKNAKPYAAESVGLILIELGRLDSAKKLLMETKKLALRNNNVYIYNRCMSHLGKLYSLQNQIDSALFNFTQVIAASKTQNYADIYLPTLIQMAKLQMQLKQLKKAEGFAKEALIGSRKIKNKALAQKSSYLLATILDKQNIDEEAILYFNIAHAYQDSILDQSVRGSIQAHIYDVSLEKEKQDKQLTRIKLDEQEEKVAVQQSALILVSVILFSLLIFFFILRRASMQRKKSNEILAKKNEELSRLNLEVNGLINTIVHDLKSPLNNMQGILYLLDSEVSQNPPAKELINHGNKVIKHGQEIVKQLLELRELEQGNKSIELKKVSIHDLLETLKEEFSPSALKKNIQLETDFVNEEIIIDEDLTKRILRNLVSNAIKFSSFGKSVQIKAKKENSAAVFIIADEGQGFSKDDLPKLYGKFQKLSAQPTGGESSNGLGLATVALIAQKLNASIDLQTEVGKGSIFTITVPLN